MMRNGRWWPLVLATVVAACVVVVVVLTREGGDGQSGPSRTIPSSSAVTSSSSSSTATSTSTSMAQTTTTARPVTTTTSAGSVPGTITVVSAAAGGGSGEISMAWDAVPNASGYRVSRSTAAQGSFSVSAEVNVLTGKAFAASGVTNLYTDQQTFFPLVFATPAPTTPSKHFHYVELVATRTYLRVAAYNDAGEGPASLVVCGSPSGAQSC